MQPPALNKRKCKRCESTDILHENKITEIWRRMAVIMKCVTHKPNIFNKSKKIYTILAVRINIAETGRNWKCLGDALVVESVNLDIIFNWDLFSLSVCDELKLIFHFSISHERQRATHRKAWPFYLALKSLFEGFLFWPIPSQKSHKEKISLISFVVHHAQEGKEIEQLQMCSHSILMQWLDTGINGTT